jgi:hypothetical protein
MAIAWGLPKPEGSGRGKGERREKKEMRERGERRNEAAGKYTTEGSVGGSICFANCPVDPHVREIIGIVDVTHCNFQNRSR